MNEDIIKKAIKGDETALNHILKHYTSYIRKLSWEESNGIKIYNSELEGELKTALLLSILRFKIR